MAMPMRRTMRRYAAPIALAMALAAAGLISWGLWHDQQLCDDCAKASTGDKVSTVVYETARVLSLNMDPHAGSNWQLAVGRVLAVLFVVFLGIQAVGRLLGDSWQNLRLLLWRWRGGHCVVCGLGRVGLPIARQLLKDGKRVLVMERDKDNENLLEIVRRGAIVLLGDATDDNALEEAHVARAAAVYIATGHDPENIEAAVDVQALAKASMHKDFHCLVHIVDPALADVLATRLALGAGHDRMRTFNAAHHTARNLIVQKLVHVRPQAADEVALYVVAGFGALGRTLVRHLAELAHFENQKRPRILILGDDPAQDADEFLAQFGRFSPEQVCTRWSSVAFDPKSDDWGDRSQRPRHDYRAASPAAVEYAANAVFAPLPKSMNDLGFLTMLHAQATRPGVRPALIFCHESDERNYSDALLLEANLRRFFPEPPPPMFLWLQRQEALHTMLAADKSSTLTAFGHTKTELTLQQLEAPREDVLGKVILAGYSGVDYGTDTGRTQIDAQWNTDAEAFRYSNRMAAVHFEVKLACHGLMLAALADPRPAEPFPSDADTLARMEHNRWMAERLMAGTAHGERNRPADVPPRRLTLCPWEELLKDPKLAKEPDKDHQQMRAISDGLRHIGLKIVKRA